ncbi:hypothetical protein [Bradyrhizobium sp. Tv2a-2]|uniref:hypothetical protein n=1 Tax=Bradyrhizobium sp. Tv2a-2 TaxID=113395 RepID=UPI000420982B|nr:hypothetical protein [Bradyrhizobium sp. Tv2a-2]
MMKKPTKMAPRAAKTPEEVCQLQTANFDVDGFWILHGINTISFAEQKLGKPSKQTITISKKAFDKMVDWYLRDQKLDHQ